MHVAYARCQIGRQAHKKQTYWNLDRTHVLFWSSVTSSIGKLPGTSILTLRSIKGHENLLMDDFTYIPTKTFSF